jgi:hypothetical protein
MNNVKSNLDALLVAALQGGEQFSNVEIKRTGEKILLPDGMQIDEAIT